MFKGDDKPTHGNPHGSYAVPSPGTSPCPSPAEHPQLPAAQGCWSRSHDHPPGDHVASPGEVVKKSLVRESPICGACGSDLSMYVSMDVCM